MATAVRFETLTPSREWTTAAQSVIQSCSTPPHPPPPISEPPHSMPIRIASAAAMFA
jgi:hypothetical protein